MSDIMRIHIGLTDAMQQQLAQTDKASARREVQNLAEKLNVTAPDVDRALEFGVLSANVSSSEVDSISSAPEVDWVERDEEKGAV